MRQLGMKYGAQRSLLGFAVAVTLVGVVGCGSGPDTGTVTGTVTMDGQPVAGVEVNFEPIDVDLGTTATGYTQAAGEYELFYPGSKKGAPAGEYIVRIVPAEMEEGAGPPVRIPAKYNDQSELTKTVESGSNTINFELTSG